LTAARGSIGLIQGKESALTAVAHNTDKARELEADEQRAWTAYSDRLRELTGEEYEAAEEESWTTLQGELHRLDRRRRTLNQTGS
jgi:uncharacterized protein YecT (DUF1311 family)